jgi:hypothetical protein
MDNFKRPMTEDEDITFRSHGVNKTGQAKLFEVAISDIFMRQNVKYAAAEIAKRLLENYLLERKIDFITAIDELLSNRNWMYAIVEDEVRKITREFMKEMLDKDNKNAQTK